MITIFRKYFAFGGSFTGDLKRGMVFSLLHSFCEAWQMLAFAVVLFAIAQGNLSEATLWMSLFIMLASMLGVFITSHFKNKYFCRGNYSMTGEKRTQIGDKMRYLPMGYFNKNSLGTIASTMTDTLDAVQDAGGQVALNVISGFISSSIIAVILFFFDWRLGAIVLGTIVVFIIINSLMQYFARRVSEGRISAQNALVEAALEYIQGMSVVRAFSLLGQAEHRLGASIAHFEYINVAIELRLMIFAVLQTSVAKASSIALCVTSTWCWASGTMSAGTCLVGLVISCMVYGKLEMSGLLASLMRQISLAMDKVNALIVSPSLPEGLGVSDAENLDIVIEDVSFSYEGRSVINEVSLSIPERSTCAFVGPSGSGKTTLAHLIARFWDVSSGRITLGGIDVRDWKLDALMAQFSMVFQGVYLFDDTIENNILFGCPTALHEDVVRAAKRACCHDFIEHLPEGYATRLHEGGASLSGGERQRISIARALLKDAPIIILDEATANVDPENERDLQCAITELTRNKTVIMIAHRLKTVRDADQIVVLDKGCVVQRGKHEQLIAEAGIYVNFVSMRKSAIGWKLGHADARGV